MADQFVIRHSSFVIHSSTAALKAKCRETRLRWTGGRPSAKLRARESFQRHFAQ
jgi:hypothetical protein